MPRHRYCLTFEAATAAAYLRSEDEADSSGRTEDDEQRDDKEGRVGSITYEQRDRHSSSARDDDVVNTQTDVFGVVERRDTHITRLPRQKTTEHLPMIIARTLT